MNANRIRIQSERGVIDLSNLESGLTSPLNETRHVMDNTKKVERNAFTLIYRKECFEKRGYKGVALILKTKAFAVIKKLC